MKQIQRSISIATLRPVEGDRWEPIISHVIGDDWALTPHNSEDDATEYVEALFGEVRWIDWRDWGKARRSA